ncbi:MAG: 50S ribosomal protein L4 [Candidatus Colwellbacteria bacterium]|nr:50S ribosomal protein L4 [Candidatus Colwellbacteria bacterium]
MMTEVYNKGLQKVGTVELPERLFHRLWSPQLVHQALLTQMANARKRVAYARGRGEVRGGGKKPWPQKGTGRSRQGSIRSPLWKGGGITHGPTLERNYSMKINKKMKQGAIFSVLSKKLKDGEVKVIDSLDLAAPKTKELSKVLTAFLKSKPNVLIVPGLGNRNVYAASRNLPKVKVLNPKTLNVYDLLKFKNVVLEKEVIPVLEEHYHVIK